MSQLYKCPRCNKESPEISNSQFRYCWGSPCHDFFMVPHKPDPDLLYFDWEYKVIKDNRDRIEETYLQAEIDRAIVQLSSPSLGSFFISVVRKDRLGEIGEDKTSMLAAEKLVSDYFKEPWGLGS